MHPVIERIRSKKQVVRAATYARFSSDMQREESIEAQEYAMEQFAEQNGITIVRRYCDRAKTGTKSDREDFLQVLKDSGKDQFDVVLVHKLDRFARKQSDSYGARLEFQKNHVALIAVAQPFDTDTPEGRLMTAIFEALAEFYSENLAAEIEKGKSVNARKGMHVGGKPPLGYDVDPETRQLVINEREAEAVRLVFKLASQGMGYERISMELRKRNIKTKRGNPFGKNSIHDLLKNEKYTGVYLYNVSASKDVEGKRNGHAQKDPDEIIKVEGGCPAIISKELFDTVQKHMNIRRRAESGGRARAQERYLLSGKLVCGECGSTYQAMLRNPSKGHPNKLVNYRCARKNASIKCINREISRDALEAVVLDRLSWFVFNDRIIPDIVAGYNQFHAVQNTDFTCRIDSYKTDLRELQRKISNITEIIAETGSRALLDKLKSLEADKLEQEQLLYEAQKELNASTISEEAIAAAFKTARQLFNDRSIDNLEDIVRVFVDKVTIYRDRVEISYNIGFRTELFKGFSALDGIPAEGDTPPKKEQPHGRHDRVVACGGEGAEPNSSEGFEYLVVRVERVRYSKPA